RTNNGDYEFLTYHLFPTADYDRPMGWTVGTGRVGFAGPDGRLKFQDADKDNSSDTLPKGTSVLVINTNFKL
ncbi:hypothetical protein B0J13DRAFT_401472, partial [Dactylonectria estremocensis]